MFRIVLILIFSLIAHTEYLNGQLLSVTETTGFLSDMMTGAVRTQEDYERGDKSIEIDVIKDDYLVIKYIWESNEDIIEYDYRETEYNYNEYAVDLKEIEDIKIGERNKKYTVDVTCKNGTKRCVEVRKEALISYYTRAFCDRPKSINHYKMVNLFYFDEKEEAETMITGIYYLLARIKQEGIKDEYKNPFSNRNAGDIGKKRIAIPLSSESGVRTLEVNIGGIDTKVILDSGASDVSIPMALEELLLSRRIIDHDDYDAPGLYTIADGSVVSSDRFRIPFIEVEEVIVDNVQCSVNESDDIILLGQSFLDRFRSWKIDNENQLLILEY